jgi:hypothetical protein
VGEEIAGEKQYGKLVGQWVSSVQAPQSKFELHF